MAVVERGLRPLAWTCRQCAAHERVALPIRSISTSIARRDETTATFTPTATTPDPPPPALSAEKELDPNRVRTARAERLLWKERRMLPVGSRRRRAAIATTDNVPFEQLPYQCFQEARKILQQNRAEVVDDIRVQRERLERLRVAPVDAQNEAYKEKRMRSMRSRLEQLKILADINDPLVKKKFEDGVGDMNKPIYRHLADLKWRSYKRKLLMQRVTQMDVVPDVLPTIDPIVSTSLSFGPRNVPHGDFVDSRVSEIAPILNIQPYDAGTRLVTIAVTTPDVPSVETDAFTSRCHFLATNIPISPTSTRISLGNLDSETQVIMPWLPPYSQKGAPYQRLAVFILEQPTLEWLESSPTKPKLPIKPDTSSANQTRSLSFPVKDIIAHHEKSTQREGFNLRSFARLLRLKAVGVDLFRSQWDEGTVGVMQRLGVPGWNVEFKRKRVEPLPYKRMKAERYR